MTTGAAEVTIGATEVTTLAGQSVTSGGQSVMVTRVSDLTVSVTTPAETMEAAAAKRATVENCIFNECEVVGIGSV